MLNKPLVPVKRGEKTKQQQINLLLKSENETRKQNKEKIRKEREDKEEKRDSNQTIFNFQFSLDSKVAKNIFFF